MNPEIILVGVDPAMSNLGLARAAVDIVTLEWRIIEIALVSTTGADKAKIVRKSSDDLRRARELRAGFDKFIKGADMAVGEVPTGTQSARGSLGNGMSIMLLAHCPVPLIEVTPTEVKMASVGFKHAAKEEIIEWAVAKCPTVGWLTKKRKGVVSLVADNEHMADAVASIPAAIDTEQFQQAVAMMRVALRVAA